MIISIHQPSAPIALIVLRMQNLPKATGMETRLRTQKEATADARLSLLTTSGAIIVGEDIAAIYTNKLQLSILSNGCVHLWDTGPEDVVVGYSHAKLEQRTAVVKQREALRSQGLGNL